LPIRAQRGRKRDLSVEGIPGSGRVVRWRVLLRRDPWLVVVDGKTRVVSETPEATGDVGDKDIRHARILRTFRVRFDAPSGATLSGWRNVGVAAGAVPPKHGVTWGWRAERLVRRRGDPRDSRVLQAWHRRVSGALSECG
jgi:hypothetical protein